MTTAKIVRGGRWSLMMRSVPGLDGWSLDGVCLMCHGCQRWRQGREEGHTFILYLWHPHPLTAASLCSHWSRLTEGKRRWNSNQFLTRGLQQAGPLMDEIYQICELKYESIAATVDKFSPKLWISLCKCLLDVLPALLQCLSQLFNYTEHTLCEVICVRAYDITTVYPRWLLQSLFTR